MRAQEAIARVYYSHVIGAMRPFEEAVPRSVLERQVRAYLEQSRAWEERHRQAITESLLAAEWDRIERSTKMPERLREIVDVLQGDRELLRECVARPALVQRVDPRGRPDEAIEVSVGHVEP